MDVLSNTAIVIPVYNEEKAISQVLDGLRQYNLPIVVIDDSSTDKTNEIVRKYEDFKTIFLLRHDQNLGVGAALKTGVRFLQQNFSKLDYVIFMDGDLQHLPSDIPKFLEEKADLVIGYRPFSSIEWKHGIGNFVLRSLCVILTRQLHDTESGFRKWKIDKLNEITLYPGYEVCYTSFIQAAEKNMNIKKVTITECTCKSESRRIGMEEGFRILFHAIAAKFRRS